MSTQLAIAIVIVINALLMLLCIHSTIGMRKMMYAYFGQVSRYATPCLSVSYVIIVGFINSYIHSVYAILP